MWFVRFSYYKTTNRTTPCGVLRCGALLLAVQCDALLLAMRCDYAILWVVLMRFLRFVQFMWFGEQL